MLVPFQARQLRNAKVLWINRRWFLERQIDVSRDDVRQRVHSWLLDEFAYVVPRAGDPESAYTSQWRVLHADRYGSSTGRTPHGGSGRVATTGAFQAKGIGVTPLVGIDGDEGHSHGCCSIEEAIREAIYSEVAAAEFPHGAVSVIAILATDLVLNDPGPVRRAILVRPAVLRIAHAERAPMFKESLTGYRNTQSDDVTRTRDVVQRWIKRSLIGLPELVTRIAEQVAFGQVHRMFSGGYFSSNLTVHGALMDYGGMRALPSWANARNLDGVVGFGDEMKIVDKLTESLAFYFSKYSRSHATRPLPGSVLRSQAQQAHALAFTRECLRMWNVGPDASPTVIAAIMQPLRSYFSSQQRKQVNYKHEAAARAGWLHGEIAQGAETQTREAISAALRQHFSSAPDREEKFRRAWITANRYLLPRESLDRELLKARIERLLAADGQHVSPESVADFIRMTIAQGRRHWGKLPLDLTVLAQVAYDGSTALLCDEAGTGRRVYWLEGPRVQGRLVLFHAELNPNRVDNSCAQVTDVAWTARIPVSDLLAFLNLPKLALEYSAH